MIKIDFRTFPNRDGAVKYYLNKMRKQNPNFTRKRALQHVNFIIETQAKEKENGNV
jgi:hypothetical protein